MRVREKHFSGKFMRRAGVILLTGTLLAGSLSLTGCFGINKPKPDKPGTTEEATTEAGTKEAESATKAEGSVSEGKYYMPDVVGMTDKESYQSVKNYLKAKGLEIEVYQGWVTNSDPKKNMLVAYTEPKAGEEITKDTKAIYIYVNEGYNTPESSEAETGEGSKETPLPTPPPTPTAGATSTETPTPTPAVHAHELKFHEAEASTCQKEGHAEYYQCESCGKIYKEKDCINEVGSVEELAITKIDHVYQLEPFRYPTCEEDGCKGYYHCDMCGTWWAAYGDGPGPVIEDHKEVITEKTGHSLVRIEAEGSTCEHAYVGTTCFKCSECGKYFLDSNGNTPAEESEVYEKPAPHTLQHIPEVPSDPEHHGTQEHWHCVFCDQNFLDAEGKTMVTDPEQLVIHRYDLAVVAGTVQEWCEICGKIRPKE